MGVYSRAVSAVVMSLAVGAHAQFVEATNSFDTDAGLFAGKGDAEWIADRGYNAPGCIRLHSPDTSTAKTSLRIWEGYGFPPDPSVISFFFLDSSGGEGHSLDIHIDGAATGLGGTCGWWSYFGQWNITSGGWSSGWELGIEDTIPDWGAEDTQYGGAFRDELIDWIENDSCMNAEFTGTAADTSVKPVALMWRFSVTNGTLLIDDFVQQLVGSGVRTGGSRPADAATTRIVGERVSFTCATDYTVAVYAADGRVVAQRSGAGIDAAIPTDGLAAGSYVVRAISVLGTVVGTVAVQ